MNTAEIRQKFLNFFSDRQHAVKESFSLIPHDDPTLLFISAGMAPFKPYFLGQKTDMKRAASCQKCFRTTDIENVGYTARHHTFFEMLGNFSFGDYFKEDAIAWAWEFITKVVGLPKELLHISIHHSDDEAGEIWKNKIGVPSERIVKLGDKDNFWTIGVGPSGPCSEIYIDQGKELSCGKPDCGVGCDCSRYLEFWNLVFTQYNRAEDGTLTPLEKKNIDTGMGLERLAAIVQGKKDNFHNDLFSGIIRKTEEITGHKFDESEKIKTALKVVADHTRALTFAISDGAIPGNEGRGYVLRKILRRAARFGYSYLGQEKPFIHSLIPTVTKIMNFYPELEKNLALVTRVISAEEERFLVTLKTGSEILSEFINSLRKAGLKTLEGEKAFLLHDTYGFPLDLTREICREEHIGVDEKAFNIELEKQRERGRANVVFAFASNSVVNPNNYKPTSFVGYDKMSCNGTIIDVIQTNDKEKFIVTDITPFYATSGGQVGDTGTITSASGAVFSVSTTEKSDAVFLHKGEFVKGNFAKGDSVSLHVNEDNRKSIMRNHTATHLLHKALRMKFGDHVKQAGSMVSPDRLRFDFTHYEAVSKDTLTEIEKTVNQQILESLDVKTSEIPFKEAVSHGAMALFDEKYGDVVRMVEVGSFSKELCGGTHLKNSSEIAFFNIVHESSVAAGIRRIEAVTGSSAYNNIFQMRDTILNLSKILDCDQKSTIEKAEKLVADIRQMKSEIDQMKKRELSEKASKSRSDAITYKDVTAYILRNDGISVDELKTLSDDLVGNHPKTLAILAGGGEKASFVVKVSKDLVEKGFNAGNMIKQIAKIAGGGGGGKPEIASAGAKDITKIDEALAFSRKLIEELVN
ncbi:MAG: alanine--tRNA ligase [Candidatus Riflebacteria bacterium]|nr:alanine--tRNA ligase [Candidatus Riflebacteria bacterium]